MYLEASFKHQGNRRQTRMKSKSLFTAQHSDVEDHQLHLQSDYYKYVLFVLLSLNLFNFFQCALNGHQL